MPLQMSVVPKKKKDISTYLLDLEITKFDHFKWQDMKQDTAFFPCAHSVL